MTKLSLPDVTLVIADTVCHDLTRLAVLDCLDKADFFDVLIASDRKIDVPGADIIPVRFANLADADRFRWYGWPDYVKSTHMLVIEWDSWVLDPSMWNADWLTYDYIGAPWLWHKSNRVGNGGFSLRSRELIEYLARNPGEFANRVHEDDVLCRLHRPHLEQVGFTWAHETVAKDFSFEREPPRPSFGFHGIFNWPHVIPTSELKSRLALCPPYVRLKPEWQEVARFA